MTVSESEVLLIHGSMHGKWCWEDVIRTLRDQGIHSRAIDLPGHGQREHEAGSASMATYAEAVTSAIDASSFGEIVLIGHSMAGQVVARAATTRPARVRTLVLINAQVLADGQTHLGTLSPERQREYASLAREQGGTTYRISDEDFHARWLQDLPRNDARVIRALALSTPQPFRPLTDPAVDQQFGAQGVPAVYLRSTDDVSGPASRTRAFVERLPAGTPIRSIPGSHDCMISEPRALSAAIAQIAGQEFHRHG